MAALRRRQRRPHDGLGVDGRCDQQRRQPGQDVGSLPVDPGPVVLRGVDQRGLPQQQRGHRRQETLQPRAFQDAAAQAVDDGHRTAPLRLDESDHPEPGLRPQIQRIGPFGVDPAQHDVDLLEGAQRTHPQLALAHHQIGALDQRKAQNRCQVSLIERRLGIDARTEHYHHRILGGLGRRVDQGQPQRLSERRGRAGPDPFVDIGNRVGHHPAVGQRIPGTGRRLRPVGIDPEPAVRGPAQITSVHEQLMAARVLDAPHRPDVTGVTEQQLGRQHAAGQTALLAIEIGQDRIKPPRALHHAGFQGLPVLGRDQQRDAVEVPRAGHRHAVAVGDGLAMPVDLDVGDAVVVDQTAQHVAQPVHPAPAALADQVGQFAPGGPHRPGAVGEFVVSGAPGRTRRWDAGADVEQRLLGAGSAVVLEQPVGIVAAEVDRERHQPTSSHRRTTRSRAPGDAAPNGQLRRTVRIRRKSRMPGAPTSVDSRASFSRSSAMSMRPAVKPWASNRLPRRDSASTALTGGTS